MASGACSSTLSDFHFNPVENKTKKASLFSLSLIFLPSLSPNKEKIQSAPSQKEVKATPSLLMPPQHEQASISFLEEEERRREKNSFFSFFSVDLLDRPRDVPARLARLPRVLGHREVGHGPGEARVVVVGDLREEKFFGSF